MLALARRKPPAFRDRNGGTDERHGPAAGPPSAAGRGTVCRDHARADRPVRPALPGPAPAFDQWRLADACATPARRCRRGCVSGLPRRCRRHGDAPAALGSFAAPQPMSRRSGRAAGVRTARATARRDAGAAGPAGRRTEPAAQIRTLVARLLQRRTDRGATRHAAVHGGADVLVAAHRAAGAGRDRRLHRGHARLAGRRARHRTGQHPEASPRPARFRGACAGHRPCRRRDRARGARRSGGRRRRRR